jgi:uncharacterized membrane protein HdeD (DUF308 family)
MSKETVLTIIGLVGIILGSIALYFAGSSEQMIVTLVGAVFVLIGIIISFFGKKFTIKARE